MLRYGAGRTVSTTTRTEDSPKPSSERRILRLTLQAGDNGLKEPTTTNSDTAEKEKDVNWAWKKKNGLIQRERPAGRESPQQHLRDMANGAPETAQENQGPKVYGVVQTGSDSQQQVMAREWTVTHLQDEMKYIREVRDSLEKVRERMYGQFGGMQQSMQKLSQEIRAANSHQRSLESEVRVRTTAMESFDQMNSSLITANIGLQKSLLENCQQRVDTRDEVKSLQSTCDKTKEKLRDKEKELAATQIENQTLRLQVESAREANSQALQELSAKLQQEYEEKLQEEQRKHREEVEGLQAQLDEYIRRLEEAERNIRIAEAKIAERDQRILEVERLLDCMGNVRQNFNMTKILHFLQIFKIDNENIFSQEKSQLSKKLQECEQRLRLMELTDTTDSTVVKRSKELQSESADLRERIKHLNDMVFCQQRKVKGMIEEVQTLRGQVAQKDMFISELLDRIAIVECENRPREVLETREIAVGCDLLPRREAKRHDVEPPVSYEPTHLHPIQHSPPVQPPPTVKPPSPALPSSTTQPLSPTLPVIPTLPSSPTQPLSPTLPVLPTLPSSQTQPLSPLPVLPTLPSPPTQPLSPLPVLPTLPSSPTQPLSPLPVLPTLPSSPTQPLSPTLPPSPVQPQFPTQPSSPTSPLQYPVHYLTTSTRPRTFTANYPPPSRLESSLLMYTPGQYSRFLQHNPSVSSGMFPDTRPSESEPPVSPVQSGRDEVDAETNTDTRPSPEESSSSLLSSRPRSRTPQVDTPFMKLLEITEKINIE
ncbi:myocardial zonula adherens protein-like isoform X2 [Anarrhichthys ocellatus]|uniref:myocardial zonula adherens protein-like isoform X2 n=1 Tax=Anarrhichthys ocellatus TaxID=433405 RepID=UPI0012ED77E7|nr:myocardial zonula adherens protein-like isoform X2 [Anarrhichthys ocellatus]